MNKYEAQPLDLMQYINTKYREPFIHERIELEGNLDIAQLTDSLDVLIQKFPILRCSYDSNENTFVENEGIRGKDLLCVDAETQGNMLLCESLDMKKKLIQLTLSNNILYITISHLVCDGGGFKQLIYLLCDIYNGNFDTDDNYFMERDFSQLSKDITGKKGITFKMLLSMMGNYKNKQIYEQSEAESSYIIEKSVASDMMKKIHSMAKEQNATLNDVFLTAYARALNKLYGFEKINIPCTVDLRKYTKEKVGIGNMTGTYQLNIRMKNGEKFSDTLSVVAAKMKKQKTTKNDIAGPMLLVSKYEKSSLEQFMKLYGGMDTGAFTDYTNLGILDSERLVFHGVNVKNAVGYSALTKSPCFQLAVSSFNGETTFSSMFQCGESEREKAEVLIDTIIEGLQLFTNAE